MRAVKKGTLVLPKAGVWWGASLRTAETCVRTAITTQPMSSAPMRNDGDNIKGDGQKQQPLSAIFPYPEPSPPLRGHPKAS